MYAAHIAAHFRTFKTLYPVIYIQGERLLRTASHSVKFALYGVIGAVSDIISARGELSAQAYSVNVYGIDILFKRIVSVGVIAGKRGYGELSRILAAVIAYGSNRGRIGNACDKFTVHIVFYKFRDIRAVGIYYTERHLPFIVFVALIFDIEQQSAVHRLGGENVLFNRDGLICVTACNGVVGVARAELQRVTTRVDYRVVVV